MSRAMQPKIFPQSVHSHFKSFLVISRFCAYLSYALTVGEHFNCFYILCYYLMRKHFVVHSYKCNVEKLSNPRIFQNKS